jgi:hypothetical protein
MTGNLQQSTDQSDRMIAELNELFVCIENREETSAVIFDSADPNYLVAHFDINPASLAELAALPLGPTGLRLVFVKSTWSSTVLCLKYDDALLARCRAPAIRAPPKPGSRIGCAARIEVRQHRVSPLKTEVNHLHGFSEGTCK